MLSGGIPPLLPLVHAVAQIPPNAALQEGQTYSALLRAQNSALVAQVGAIQITLPEGAPFVAGQRVLVLVVSSGNPLQVEIAPAPPATAAIVPAAIAGAPAATGGPAPGLDTLLRPILQALGKLDLAPRIASLLPPQLPRTTASLQPLLTALLAERGLGRDLQQMQQVLATASSQGAVPADAIAAVAQWLGLAPGANGETWRNLLARARAERAVEARIAQMLGPSGNRGGLAAARESASTLAGRLLDSEPFAGWLRARGELEPFKALAQRLGEHARGGDLQNLRAQDVPYQFLELPVREADGFHRLHMHSFSEGRGGGKSPQSGTHRTILDIETTQLGPLWIALQASGDQCACRIRTALPEVAALFESEADGLRVALEEAGYRTADITAELWDGQREEALLQLFAPLQKLDLEI